MNRIALTIVVMLVSSTAIACNIPVFRYALERWRPDACQVLVFHNGPLTADQKLQIERLESAAILAGGQSNIEVRRQDTATEITDEEFRKVWKIIPDEDKKQLPRIVVRTNHARGLVNHWQGSLSDGLDAVLDSPVRTQLRQRLLNGDSVVWLMLKSTDESRNSAIREMLTKQCGVLSKKLTLPEGIGEPGSELHSDVPLFLKFTTLEFSAEDEQERFLVKLFSGFQPEAFAEKQPLLIPVFGRGRALEVIPANRIDEKLIDELTMFLCGACSCQVKESNPGFDLLITAAWDRDLFGEGGLLPPPPKTVGDRAKEPRLLPIAPGRKK